MLERFINTLRSEEIRTLVKQRHKDLLNLNVASTKQAIDLFCDLKAPSLVEKALDNKNYETKL